MMRSQKPETKNQLIKWFRTAEDAKRYIDAWVKWYHLEWIRHELENSQDANSSILWYMQKNNIKIYALFTI